MKRIIIIIVLILTLIPIVSIKRSLSCPNCCKWACKNSEKPLSEEECEKIIEKCYDRWNKLFIKKRIEKIKKIKKSFFDFKLFASVKEKYSLSYKEFLDEYLNDREKFEKKYKNKLIKISGKIVDLLPGDNIISISYKKNIDTVSCNDVDSDFLKTLSMGQEINIKGYYVERVAGYGLVKIFYFQRCVVEE